MQIERNFYKKMYFSQVTVHSVGQLGIWHVERSQERRRTEQLSSHENVLILTRINESLTSEQTERSLTEQHRETNEV
jgi:hypothetical protein